MGLSSNLWQQTDENSFYGIMKKNIIKLLFCIEFWHSCLLA